MLASDCKHSTRGPRPALERKAHQSSAGPQHLGSEPPHSEGNLTLNTSQLCVLSSKSVAPEAAVCSTAALLTVDYNRALSIAFAYNDSIYFSVASASIAHCSMISTVPCGATIPLCLSIFLWCSPIRLRLFLCFLPEECSRY